MSVDVTYPPLDVPKPVAEGVWIVDSGPQRLGPLVFPVRMTVLRLAGGALWLHSPTRHTPALAEHLATFGPVRHLVAPDTAHWTHLAGWQTAFPQARVWTAPGTAARARRQSVALRVDRDLSADPPPDWAAEIEHAVFACTGFVEIAFHHRPSGTLILTDTLQNLDAARLPLRMRLFAHLTGTLAPHGRAPLYLRLAMRARHWRAANRATAERVIAWAPRRAIFAHGAWYERDAATRLERAFAWLLR